MSANSFRALLTKFQNCPLQHHHRALTNHHCHQFNQLLNSCTSLSDLKRIHALILTSGSHQNLPLLTRLISLASCSSVSLAMDYARKLFDGMPRRDVFVHNMLIRGYANLGPCQEALIIFRIMHRTGVFPDYYTFPSVLRASAILSAIKEGREVHCNVVKRGYGLDVFVQSALVTMYAQCGEVMDSELVFGEMGAKNVVSWTAMIAGHVQNGWFEKGLNVFHEMMVLGTCKPNAITLASMLPACSGLGYLSFGMLIHGYGIKLGFGTDVALANALIVFYGKCSNVKKARDLFDDMEVRSLVSWNAMIAAYEQNGSGASAIKLYRRMLNDRVDYDYITVVSVISACASLGALNTGQWVHEFIKRKGLQAHISIINALIDMYAKCGNLELAREVFNSLPHRTVVSWTAIIGAFASHGHGEEALELFLKMKEEGTRPNNFTFIAILTACRHSGLVDEGREHFESMTRDYSIVPGLEHCACMVDLLGRAGKLLEAYEFVENMPIEPDVGIWEALLSACRIHGNLELAEVIADRLFQLNPQRVSLYVLMKHIYAEAGRWDDVARMKIMLEEKELRKTPGQSLVEVGRRSHTFLSGSISRPAKEVFN